jgi:putative transcriptional regulator
MIEVRLAEMMGKRKVKTFGKLVSETGISRPCLRKLWYGNAKSIRFDALDALCKALKCQPGDLLVFIPDEEKDKDED